MLTIDPELFAARAIDPDTAAFAAALEAQLSTLPAQHELAIAATRRARAEGKGIFPLGGPAEGSVWAGRESDPPAPALRLSRPGGAPRGIYLHIHGGGWTFNRPDYYDIPNQRIARDTGLAVASVRYRLAPEHRWPAPLRDVLEGIAQARSRWPGLPIAIGGESAGAHLAAAALIALRDQGGLDGVVGAVLNYGMYDLRMTASMANWGARKLILSTPTVAWFVANLLGNTTEGGTLADDPGASPLLADLAGMPPALFQIGTLDPLLDDSLMLATRWSAAGAAAELAVYPGGVHAFDAFELAIAEAFRARQSDFLARLFSNAPYD
ncbi:MAG: alpha/beta hydrolase fold domain-containing protein [Pseudomonadota bacterium]